MHGNTNAVLTPATAHSAARSRTQQSGWTPARRGRFLELLAAGGDVQAAAAVCGLSRQSLYKLRRRDRDFAEEWECALAGPRARAERQLAEAPGERFSLPVRLLRQVIEEGEVGRPAREFVRLLLDVAGAGDRHSVDTEAANSSPRTP